MKTHIAIVLFFCFFKAFSQEIEQETKILNGRSKVKAKSEFSLKSFHLGLYPSVNAFIEPLSKDWANKNEGLGFFQGYGGTVELGKSLKYNKMIFFAFGRDSWGVSRRLIANDVIINKVDSDLLTNSYQLGSKFTNKKMIFFSPSFGLSKIKLTTTNKDEPIELIGQQNKVFANLKLGKQIKVSFLKLEIGTQYRFIYSDSFFGIYNSIHQIGVFSGITF